jgi:hypothetical protein
MLETVVVPLKQTISLDMTGCITLALNNKPCFYGFSFFRCYPHVCAINSGTFATGTGAILFKLANDIRQ